MHREVDGARNETFCVCCFVQRARPGEVTAGCDRHLWPKSNLDKLAAAVGCFLHDARSLIDVGFDNDPGLCAKMQIPELMASRERSNQQFFRRPASWIAAKGGVRRPSNRFFS